MSQVKVTQSRSTSDEEEQVVQRVAKRAYELFERRGSPSGDPWADWFAAERETVRRPAVEVREEDGAILVSASIAGIDPGDVRVEITPQDVVIKAEKESKQGHPLARVHQSEFRAGRVFRLVHLPFEVDPTKAQADYRNGLLTVKAPLLLTAEAARRDARVA